MTPFPICSNSLVVWSVHTYIKITIAYRSTPLLHALYGYSGSLSQVIITLVVSREIMHCQIRHTKRNRCKVNENIAPARVGFYEMFCYACLLASFCFHSQISLTPPSFLHQSHLLFSNTTSSHVAVVKLFRDCVAFLLTQQSYSSSDKNTLRLTVKPMVLVLSTT